MRSYWPLILTLAAMWGASYLFIKVAVDDIPPAAMTELRVLVAGLLLLGYLVVRMGGTKAVRELRAAWVPCAVLGVINAALPMGLVAWGETLTFKGVKDAGLPPDVSHSLDEYLNESQPKLLVVMGPEARTFVDSLGFPLADELDESEGELQRFTPTIQAVVTPDVDASLDEQAAKTRFWKAFKIVGTWWAELPPY